MSHQNVVAFMKKVLADNELQAKLGAMQGDGGPESVRQLLQIAAEAGFSFTEQDLDDLFLAMAASQTEGELTPQQLEAVAGGTELLTATQDMQEMNLSFSMQYLGLQQNMQQENRQFNMISNIMKTKHDTAKNAINNVR